jgi:hypothetical protein
MKIGGSACVSAAAFVVVGLAMMSCGGSPGISPTPDPTPTKAAPDKPPVLICPLGDGSTTAVCKRKGFSNLLADVDAAIERTVAKQPQTFKLDHEASPGTRQYEVVDKAAYFAGVLDELRNAGFCADLNYANYDLIDVKNDAGFSERFAIYQTPDTHGYILHDGYQKTCTPASFPVTPDPNGPPPNSGCDRPYPPPIGSFNASAYMTLGPVWTLDSTPIVTYDKEYCASVGFTDGRIHCAVRVEGDPEREACENWRVGHTADTGLPGPTWTRNGLYCTGPASGCEHHPDNPYQLHVYENGSGHYRVCAENGVCAEVDVER